MLGAYPVTVHELFSGRLQFKIPVYQRHYVWNKEEQWEPLWQDIIEKNEENARVEVYQDANPHFFGAIVTYQTDRRAGDVQVYDIIDGQQRLTTLQIVLCSICNVCHSAKLDDLADQAQEYIANSGLLKDRIRTTQFRKPNEKYKIVPTEVDKQSFCALIDGDDDNVRGRIKEANIYFEEQIREYMNHYKSEIDRLHDPRGRMTFLLDTVLQYFKLVQITVNAHANTGRIFESINARGRTINEFDLLRNSIFLNAKFSGENVDDKELHKDYWLHFEDNFWIKELDDNYGNILEAERFLQYFLMAKLKKEKVIYQDLFYTYDRIYRAKLRKDQNFRTELFELQKYSKVYRVMVNCQHDSNEQNSPHSKRRMDLIAKRMEFYKHLSITQVFPFILFIVNELELTHDELDKVFDTLESYMMRRILLKGRRSNYSKLFVQALNSIGETKAVSDKLMVYLSTLGDNEKCPNDDDIRRLLSQCGNSNFDRTITRYILYRIELFKEGSDDVLRNKLNFNNRLTIEHVLPKSRDGHTSEEKDLVIRSIGNLTLVTNEWNNDLADKDFDEKRKLLWKNVDLRITQEIVEKEDWGSKEIREREKLLWQIFCNDLWQDVFLYSGKMESWHPNYTEGFIIDEEGQKIPVHKSDIQRLAVATLRKDMKVSFKKVMTKDGFKAVNVVRAD